MKKRLIALVVLAAMVMCLFAACDSAKKGPVTQEEAKAIALEELNLKASEVGDIHVHIGELEGTVCYNIHITVGEQEYNVYINAETGEVVEHE